MTKISTLKHKWIIYMLCKANKANYKRGEGGGRVGRGGRNIEKKTCIKCLPPPKKKKYK